MPRMEQILLCKFMQAAQQLLEPPPTHGLAGPNTRDNVRSTDANQLEHKLSFLSPSATQQQRKYVTSARQDPPCCDRYSMQAAQGGNLHLRLSTGERAAPRDDVPTRLRSPPDTAKRPCRRRPAHGTVHIPGDRGAPRPRRARRRGAEEARAGLRTWTQHHVGCHAAAPPGHLSLAPAVRQRHAEGHAHASRAAPPGLRAWPAPGPSCRPSCKPTAASSGSDMIPV